MGPLRAAPSLAVHKAPPASWEGTPASTAVVDPGFLAIAVVVLEEEQGSNEAGRTKLNRRDSLLLFTFLNSVLKLY